VSLSVASSWSAGYWLWRCVALVDDRLDPRPIGTTTRPSEAVDSVDVSGDRQDVRVAAAVQGRLAVVIQVAEAVVQADDSGGRVF